MFIRISCLSTHLARAPDDHPADERRRSRTRGRRAGQGRTGGTVDRGRPGASRDAPRLLFSGEPGVQILVELSPPFHIHLECFSSEAPGRAFQTVVSQQHELVDGPQHGTVSVCESFCPVSLPQRVFLSVWHHPATKAWPNPHLRNERLKHQEAAPVKKNRAVGPVFGVIAHW